MVKLPIGTIVKAKDRTVDGENVYCRGIIVGYECDESENMIYQIRWDEKIINEDGEVVGHDCDEKCEDGYGWNAHDYEIERVHLESDNEGNYW